VGYFHIKSRIEDTVPGGPLPAGFDLIPQGDINYWKKDITNVSGGNTEYDYMEIFGINETENGNHGGACPGSQILPHNGGGFLRVWDPCYGGQSPAAPNIRQPWDFAARVTSDGTTGGFTVWVNGVQTSGGGRFSLGTGDASNAGQLTAWSDMNACSFGGTNNPCVNVPINSVSQCGDGNTCLHNNQLTQLYRQPNGMPIWIDNDSGISGMHGAHHATSNNCNPCNDFELTDLPWPGGTYSGGSKFNAMTARDVWIYLIEFWTCPAWDETINPQNTARSAGQQCNGTVLP